MKTLIISFIICLSLSSNSTEISMQGIKINDSEKILEKINLNVIVSDRENATPQIKYRTENGNDLSITLKERKVVYLENDWLRDKKGIKPLLTNFIFGETTLKDIRKSFGTNGFTYEKMTAFTTDTHLIEFNCFEIDSPNNEVLVIITKVSLDNEITEENVAEKLKLDAIILANKDYLDEIWQGKKIYDPKNKKVKL